MSDYPEHEKLIEVKEQSQAIGEFLDNSPYQLCWWREAGDNSDEHSQYIWTEHSLKVKPERKDYPPTLGHYIDGKAEHNPDFESWNEGYYPVHGSIQKILADYFGIDQNKIEAEKRQMLEQIRKDNT
jgi:hypothetical protein